MLVGLLILTTGGFLGVDRWIYERVSVQLNTPDPADADFYHRTHWAWDGLRLFSHALGVAAGALAIAYFRNSGIRRAVAYLIIVGAVAIGSDQLQRTLGRLRPNQSASALSFAPAFYDWSSRTPAGFPSGEAATATASALLLAREFRRLRGWLYCIAIGVCVARGLFGMHYLSDVAAGAVLALLLTGLGTGAEAGLLRWWRRRAREQRAIARVADAR